MPTDINVVKDARDHVELVTADEHEIREEADRCADFLALQQWDPQMMTMRGTRPTLTVDQLNQYLSQVVNDWRRNRLGVKVSPSDGGDPQTAEMLDGVIRQIEYESMAHVAYDRAFEQMAGMGRGYFEVTTRRKPGTFDQDIRVKMIQNAQSVYMDPFCNEIDYSDQKQTVVTAQYGYPQYEQRFGKKAQKESFAALGPSNGTWFTENTVQVAASWRATETPRNIMLLSQPIAVPRNGEAIMTNVVYEDELLELDQDILLRRGIEILDKDIEKVCKIKRYIVNGYEVLEETDWTGYCIPIIPMIGKELYRRDRKKIFSLISRALDSQRLINYSLSSMAERMSMFCRTPVVGVVGQFKTQRTQWEQINTQAYAFLEYDQVVVGDRPAPAPERADFDPRIDQMVLGANVSKEYIRGTLGMYQASLGESETRARSGVAVEALKREGDNATYDFLDNGARAIELAGRIMVDLIVNVYPGRSNVKTRDVHGNTNSLASPQFKGSYLATVTAAPSHETLRKEAAEYSLKVYESLPPQMQVKAAPVMLRFQDWHGAKELADAIDPNPPSGPIDPKIKQVLDQQAEVIDGLTKEVNELLVERQQRTLENATKIKVAEIQASSQIRIAELKVGSEGAEAEADRLADELEGHKGRAHEVALAAATAATTPEEPAEVAE